MVAGGTSWEGGAKVVHEAVWRFDGERWTAIARLPRPYSVGVFGSIAGSLVLYAGDDGIRTHAGGFVLNADGSSHLLAPLPRPVAYAGTVQKTDWLYILGGTSDLRDLAQLTAGFVRVHPATGMVDELPDFPGGPVVHAALAAPAADILVFPGGTYDATDRVVKNTSEAWKYVIAARRWERIAPYPFAVRGLGVCTIDSRHVLLAGGNKTEARSRAADATTGAAFLYDTLADRYEAVPPLPYAAMLVGIERLGEQVYVFGGEDRARHRAVQVFGARIADLLAAAR